MHLNTSHLLIAMPEFLPKLLAIPDKVPPSLGSHSGIIAIASSSWGKVARKMGSFEDSRYFKVKDHFYAYLSFNQYREDFI